MNLNNRKAEIRIMSADNIEIAQSVIEKEYVVLTTLNSVFYAFYTQAGQLLIYSTKTTQLVIIRTILISCMMLLG